MHRRTTRTVVPLLAATLAAVLTACSGGSVHPSTAGHTTAAGHIPSPGAGSTTAPPSAPLGGTPLSGAALLKHLVPYPDGSRPWTSNKTGVMGLNDFVSTFYQASERTSERSLTAKRGFTTSVRRGWFNADGTQSDIWLVEFAQVQGARSMYLSLTSNWARAARPVSTFPDTAVHGIGELVPTLDSLGNASTKVAAAVGRTVIYVRVYSPSLEKSATTALMAEQYAAVNAPATPSGKAV